MCKKHHYERNRKVVQQGLDRRREDAREAAHDAAWQGLQAELRKSTQRREAEKVAAEDAVCRHVNEVINETDRKIEQQKTQLHREQYRRDRKALEEKQFKKCLLLTFGSLMIATAMVKFLETGLLPIMVATPTIFLTCLFSIYNFVAYASRNRKAEVHHA